MGIVGKQIVVSDRKGNEFCDQTTKVTNSQKTKKSRRRQKKVSLVQNLFDTCNDVFASVGTGVVPCHEHVERLRLVMDNMTAEDVGLSPDMPYFRTTNGKTAPIITYLHLHECDKFSIGIFCLPPSAVIPLHNHPGMTVFSKLLFGTMHIKSYDWVANAPCVQSSVPRLANIKVDSDFISPCNTSILYPAAGGNMHCFTARTACAVLDVLGPPYSDPDGRHCTYYIDYPFSKFSVNGLSVPEEERDYAWLEEREKPEDLAVVGELYRGPMFVDRDS